MLQEVSSQSVKAQSSDLAILSAAARQLFESTVTMSTDSVVSILAALATVSQKSVPQAVQQPGHPRQVPCCKAGAVLPTGSLLADVAAIC